MNTHAQVAPIALTISDIFVRQDSEGRYCINDLHKAAGHLGRHQPSNWLRTQQAKDLIDELGNFCSSDMRNKSSVEVIRTRGNQQGTYIVKELVYAYAMWISPKFHVGHIALLMFG